MSKSIMQPDGTRCYVGANCRRHGAYNRAQLPAPTAAEDIKRQIDALKSNSLEEMGHNTKSEKEDLRVARGIRRLNRLGAIFSRGEINEYYERDGEWERYTSSHLDELRAERDAEVDDELSAFYHLSEEDREEYIPILNKILYNNKAEFDRDEVHYRIYHSPRDGKLTSICVQWFDYYDYDEKRFVGEHHFADEDEADEAVDFLNQKILKI